MKSTRFADPERPSPDPHKRAPPAQPLCGAFPARKSALQQRCARRRSPSLERCNARVLTPVRTNTLFHHSLKEVNP